MLKVDNHRTLIQNDFGLSIGPFSFQVTHGNRVGITGPSGCGKTTFLREIIKVYTENGRSDSIKFLPVSVDYLPQELALFPWYPPVKSVKIMSGFHDVDKSEYYSLIVERLGMRDAMVRCYNTLSTGEKQRAALICALCSAAELLIIDEPFTALDARRKFECLELINERVAHRKLGLVIVSHDLEILTYLCNEIIAVVNHVPARFKFAINASSENYHQNRKQGRYDILTRALLKKD